jgi:hypothetical protein
MVSPRVVDVERLPDDAIVVRGGLMARETLDLSADNHHAEVLAERGEEEWALSVFSQPTDGVGAVCRRAGVALSHSKIRVSTVGVLRAIGYDVIRDETYETNGHCLLPLRPPPWDWGELTHAGFLLPQENPERRPKGG